MKGINFNDKFKKINAGYFYKRYVLTHTHFEKHLKKNAFKLYVLIIYLERYSISFLEINT